MCGVCAGRPGKTNLGDVIAAERLFFHDTGKRLPEAVQQDLRTYNLRADWKVALEHFGFTARFQEEAWWKQRPVPYAWQENWVLAKLNEGVENPSSLPESKAFCPQWDKVIESWKRSSSSAGFRSSRPWESAGSRRRCLHEEIRADGSPEAWTLGSPAAIAPRETLEMTGPHCGAK